MRLSRPLTSLLVAAAVLVLAASCGHREHSGGTIRIASVLPAEHPSSQALAFFQTRLDELSGGQLRVRLFLNSQLGNDIETVEMCQMGNIEAVFISSATMSQFLPKLSVLSMPFIFRDNEHAYAVVDGPVGDGFREKLSQINFRVLGFFDAGSRNMMTKRGPIESPADLVGLKIRVMPAPMLVDTINALGAAAISIPQGEVYTALQTGVIDGWENNPQTAASFRMYETGCIHYTHTKHLMIPDMLLLNHAFYAGLPPHVRAWVDQAAREAEQHQRALWQESEKETMAQLQQAGMKFHHVPLEPFRAKVDSVYEKYFRQYGPAYEAICRQIMETQ